MNRRNFLTATIVAIIALIAIVYYTVFRAPEAPSAPIEAIPLDAEATSQVVVVEPTEEPEPTKAPEPTEAPTEVPTEEPEPTEAPVEEPEPTEELVEEPEPTEAPTEEPEPTEAPTEEPEPTEVPPTAVPTEVPPTEVVEAPQSSGAKTFEMVTDASSARFELDEDLRGNRITVVGTANQVAGQMRFDPADLSSTQVGIIQVNARTFVTDSDFRNRAIHNRILSSGNYEFVTFEPTELIGLPASAAVGERIDFQIVGNLTIRDVTQPARFDTNVTALSENEIEGVASSVILIADYGLTIPEVPSVANVEEELELYLDFTAVAIEEASEGGEEAAEEEAETAGEEAVVAEEPAVLSTTKLNLNNVTADELLNTIPNFGNRMVREFFEYQPYISIQQFRREIGKYIDEAQVAEYEQYVYVPIDIDNSDAETLKQLPGVDDAIAAELMAARPYGTNDAFLAKLAEYLEGDNFAVAGSYLVPQ